LSYSRFDYGDLRASAGTTAEPVSLSIEVTNAGERAGHEVVQLYVRDDVASVARPDQQLVGFTRLWLEPGATRDVDLVVDPSRLAFFDEAMRFVVEPGSFTFSVGASSVDIRSSATVTLTGPVVEHRQSAVIATEISHGGQRP
jgi:beta-glucosidase